MNATRKLRLGPLPKTETVKLTFGAVQGGGSRVQGGGKGQGGVFAWAIVANGLMSVLLMVLHYLSVKRRHIGYWMPRWLQ